MITDSDVTFLPTIHATLIMYLILKCSSPIQMPIVEFKQSGIQRQTSHHRNPQLARQHSDRTSLLKFKVAGNYGSTGEHSREPARPALPDDVAIKVFLFSAFSSTKLVKWTNMFHTHSIMVREKTRNPQTKLIVLIKIDYSFV